MSASKEAELMTAVILYAVRCFSEGDLTALQEMNFGPKELNALREISMSDLFRARELTAHCLQVRLNRDVYWPMLEHLRRGREAEILQQEMMQADAPHEMMLSLFAMSAHEYTRQRRMLTAQPAKGRTPDAGDEQSAQLWTLWRERVDAAQEDTLTPRDYLTLHHVTGISLRIIWNCCRRWAAYGDCDTALIHPVRDPSDATSTP